jgi:predicted secreted hydrolase
MGEPLAFRSAEGQRAWEFPRDHGQHPDFRLEWWYYTGLVSGEDGRRFGFQVTFFRRGVIAAAPNRDSAWAARSLYAAQAALTVPEDRPGQGRFLHDGIAARDSLSVAGAAAAEQRVWVRAWRAEPLPGDAHGVHLSVAAKGFGLELALGAQRPPVLHGANGLDRKGEPAGQASWYYSLTRLRVSGRVFLDGRAFPVTGTAWMDHEFSSSQLGAEQTGWDWFGLRLSDGSDLMLYRLRRRDGSIDPHSGGTWVAPEGVARVFSLGPDEARLTPTRWWRSAETHARYPVSWRIALPALELELSVRPLMNGQELSPTQGIPFAYWEGAVRVEGTRAGRPVMGEGYLELTGYAGDLAPALR